MEKIQIKKRVDIQKCAPIILMLLLMILLTIANRNFLTAQSIYNLLLQVSALGIVALGAMMVLLTAGIDFTGGYGLSLAGVTAGIAYIQIGNNPMIFIITALTVGALVGLVNGLIITQLKLSPFITTLATMSICKGISLTISSGHQVTLTDKLLLAIGSGKIFGFLPYSFLVFVVGIFIIYICMNKTRFGVYTYAIGGNEDSVTYSGIKIKLYKVLVYVAAGVCYGLAAIITCCQVTIITTDISGSFLLDGIAAAVVGGTSLLGGKGNILGTVVGAFIITLITTMLNFFKVPFLLRDVIKGVIIVAVLIFNVIIAKTAEKQKNKI